MALISSKKAKGLCVCSTALYGNAASRLSEVIPSDGAWAYGGYPDIDALFKQQAVETDHKKREAMLHQIQRLVHERVRYGPIFEYVWPSGVGPRVAEPALMLIDPYPWSAPLEEVRLKQELRSATACCERFMFPRPATLHTWLTVLAVLPRFGPRTSRFGARNLRARRTGRAIPDRLP